MSSSDSDENFLNCIKMISKSKIRKQILSHLSSEPLNTLDLTNLLKIKYISSVSRTIHELLSKGLIIATTRTNETKRKFLYKISSKGLHVLDYLYKNYLKSIKLSDLEVEIVFTLSPKNIILTYSDLITRIKIPLEHNFLKTLEILEEKGFISIERNIESQIRIYSKSIEDALKQYKLWLNKKENIEINIDDILTFKPYLDAYEKASCTQVRVNELSSKFKYFTELKDFFNFFDSILEKTSRSIYVFERRFANEVFFKTNSKIDYLIQIAEKSKFFDVKMILQIEKNDIDMIEYGKKLLNYKHLNVKIWRNLNQVPINWIPYRYIIIDNEHLFLWEWDRDNSLVLNYIIYIHEETTKIFVAEFFRLWDTLLSLEDFFDQILTKTEQEKDFTSFFYNLKNLKDEIQKIVENKTEYITSKHKKEEIKNKEVNIIDNGTLSKEIETTINKYALIYALKFEFNNLPENIYKSANEIIEKIHTKMSISGETDAKKIITAIIYIVARNQGNKELEDLILNLKDMPKEELNHYVKEIENKINFKEEIERNYWIDIINDVKKLISPNLLKIALNHIDKLQLSEEFTSVLNKISFDKKSLIIGELGSFFDINGYKEEATKLYKIAIKYDSRNSDALSNLGVSHFEQKQFSEALEYYKKALKLSPNDKTIIYNLAIIYDNLKDFENTFYYYNQYLKFDPNNFEILLQLGLNLNAMKKNEEAKKVLIKAFKNLKNEKNIENPLLLINMGLAYLKLEQFRKAISIYTKAIKINPKNPSNFMIYCNIGYCYSYLNEYDKANEAFKEAVRINDNFVEGHANLGILEFNHGNYQKAISELKIAYKFAKEQNLLERAKIIKKYMIWCENGIDINKKLEKIDKEILNCIESQSLSEMKQGAIIISNELQELYLDYKNEELPRDILRILEYKTRCFSVLSDLLQGKKEVINLSDKTIDIEAILKAINILYKFQEITKDYDLKKDIPKDKENELLSNLKELKDLDGEYTSYINQKFSDSVKVQILI